MEELDFSWAWTTVTSCRDQRRWPGRPDPSSERARFQRGAQWSDRSSERSLASRLLRRRCLSWSEPAWPPRRRRLARWPDKNLEPTEELCIRRKSLMISSTHREESELYIESHQLRFQARTDIWCLPVPPRYHSLLKPSLASVAPMMPKRAANLSRTQATASLMFLQNNWENTLKWFNLISHRLRHSLFSIYVHSTFQCRHGLGSQLLFQKSGSTPVVPIALFSI